MRIAATAPSFKLVWTHTHTLIGIKMQTHIHSKSSGRRSTTAATAYKPQVSMTGCESSGQGACACPEAAQHTPTTQTRVDEKVW